MSRDVSGGGSTEPNDAAARRRLVLNPTSGDGAHANRVRELADEYGFSVVETERAGHASELAETAAADGVDLLAACGGDGTIHEVVRGLVAADALDDVTFCVIPAGTANLYASGLGIRSVREGFAAAERGETRRLDLGMAGDEPFVLSAIAGLPAEASVATGSELKARIGTFAFVIEGLRAAREFDGVQVAIAADTDDGTYAWRGEALSVLVGVLRDFTGENDPSNAETGRFEVTIVEQVPPTDAVAELVEQRLLDRETPHVTTLEATALEIDARTDEPVAFSLDGERRAYDHLDIRIRPAALRACVGTDGVG
ncbi:diacylglycerol/lipid kinase family protein [Halovivax limisalsi]|uniref:diacylglycerol/lipid kinase family protein n=1 Tax=Halovivax limisalsi TaxID=1453760 RepID=UPI001FFCD482|nr:YegS/Rv2252/BmrU family lipid kinase [Halovivax limisalsi]